MANPVLQLIITARDATSDVIDRVGAGLRGVGNAASAALEPLRTMGGVLAAAFGIGGAKEIIDRADAYTSLTSALKVATNSEEEYQAALKNVVDISRATFSNLDSTATLYAKVAANAEKLGLTQQQVADVTTSVNLAMQLSGADANTAAGAITQFSQALASGTLRGDEFNSVNEAAPQLLQAVADGLGVAKDELRAMAEQGMLTTDRVVQAILSQKNAIEKLYAETGVTVAQQLQQLSNEATLFVGKINEQIGATAGLNNGLAFLGRNLDAVAALMGAGFAVAIAKGTIALQQHIAASLAARQAAADQAIAAAAQQRAAIASAEAQVVAANAAAVRAIAEQRLAQQQLVALQAIAGLYASEEALTLARAQASTAANAATIATQRLHAAQAALAAAQGPAAASMTLFSRAMALLTGPAGLILMAVASFGLLFTAFRDQKPVTDDLTASTDQYTASLAKLNKEQLNARLVELNAAMKEQQQAVTDASAAVDDLSDGHQSLIDVMSDSRPVAVQLTEAQGQLANEQQKLDQIQQNLKTTMDALVVTQQQQTTGNLQAVTALNQQVTALDKLQTLLSDREKYLKSVTDAQMQETQALLDAAKAKGDNARVDELTIQLATQRARAAQEQANLDNAGAVAARNKVDALTEVERVFGRLTPQQAESLRQAREDVVLKNAQAQASQAVANGLAEQAEQARLSTQSLAGQLEQLQDNAQAQQTLADEQLKAGASAIKVTRAEIDLAEAKGDTAEMTRLQTRLAEQELEQARRAAAAKQQEADALREQLVNRLKYRASLAESNAELEREIQLLIARTNAAQGDADVAQKSVETTEEKTKKTQESTDATEKNVEETDKSTEATKENAEATDGAAKSSGGLAGHIYSMIGFWRAKTAALSEATAALFEFKAGLRDGLDISGFANLSDEAQKATQEIEHANALIRLLSQQMLYSTGSVGYFMDKVQKAGAEATKAYYEQKLAAESLQREIERVGTTAVTRFGTTEAAINGMTGSVEQAMSSMNLLNDQDLQNLRSAMDSANQKLRQMQEETQSARERLAEMNAELLEAQGMDQKAELLRQQLDYQQQLAEIEKQRLDADASGNREMIVILNQQRAVLDQINRAKVQEIQTQTEASRTTDAATEKMRTYANEAERAANATQALARQSLGGLVEQTGQLHSNLQGVNELL